MFPRNTKCFKNPKLQMNSLPQSNQSNIRADNQEINLMFLLQFRVFLVSSLDHHELPSMKQVSKSSKLHENVPFTELAPGLYGSISDDFDVTVNGEGEIRMQEASAFVSLRYFDHGRLACGNGPKETVLTSTHPHIHIHIQRLQFPLLSLFTFIQNAQVKEYNPRLPNAHTSSTS